MQDAPGVEQLFKAVGDRDRDLVRQIIDADPALARAQNNDRLPVLQWARFIGDRGILDTLVAAGPPLDVFDAASIDEVHALTAALAATPDAALAYSHDGFTALHFAAFYGAPQAARLLLDAGARVDAVTRNFLENMPLHAAAAGGHSGICRLLLERGADVNAAQHGGFRPLHAAAQHGDAEMTRLFLDHGADVSLANDDGALPHDLARAQGHTLVAALLAYEASKS